MLKIPVIFLLPFLLLFSQCQGDLDQSFLNTPERGEWYTMGESLSFISVNKSRKDETEKLAFTIKQKGKTLSEIESYYDEIISLPIPLESKSGILDLSYHSQLNPSKTGSTQVYYLEESYGPISLSYYPPMAMVNSIVEVTCLIDNFTGDPYCRWSLEDQIIGGGFLSQGGDRISFYGPHKKGNYTIRLDLFPEEPLKNSHLSPYFQSAEIFIDESVDKDGAMNSHDWQTLFYCDGTHIDRGRSFLDKGSDSALNFLSASDLKPRIIGGDRGYGFTSLSSLEYDGKILQGQRSDLSIIQTRLILDPIKKNENTTVQIFHSQDGSGNNSFSLFRKDKTLLFSMGLEDDFIRSSMDFPLSLEGVPFWLVIAVEQRDQDLLIRWYLDSILIEESIFKSRVQPEFFSGGGSTVWGRGNYPSFEGVLLEWGFNGEQGESRKWKEEMKQ